jgi:hypothetical protein
VCVESRELQHLDVIEDLLQGVRARVLLKTEAVGKLRRNRPSNLLKGKCREVVVRSRGEASRVDEAVKEFRGETLFSFRGLHKEERMVKIL